MAKKIKTKKKVTKKEGILKDVTSNTLDKKPIILDSTLESSNEQIKKNNKLLIGILSLLGLILLSFFTGYYLINSQKSFDYKGVEFNIIQEGKLVFYNTQVPIYDNRGEKISAYNFYLRTDPRKLGKMNFNETIIPMKLMAINYSEEMSCSGYGIIALTNIINLYELIGTKITLDKNATCDSQGRYMFLNFQKTNETSIEKFGKNCYNFNVKDCDIFPPTERLMLDTFIKIKQENIRAISSSA